MDGATSMQTLKFEFGSAAKLPANDVRNGEDHNFCDEDVTAVMNGNHDVLDGKEEHPVKSMKQKVTFQERLKESAVTASIGIKHNKDSDLSYQQDVKNDLKMFDNVHHPVPPEEVLKKLPEIVRNIVSTSQSQQRLKFIPQTGQICELQTVIRDRQTSRSDFIFYADRLIRLVIEEGLNQLPYSKCTVTTPTGLPYEGLKYCKGNCGVSIIRSGEAMEKGLRECCRSIRIGKILVRSDAETREARVLYAKFPPDIACRKVLLMYPILGTGNTVSKAVNILKEHGVYEENIILLTLFCSPEGVQAIMFNYPMLTVLTSEIHEVVPYHFGEKYFGTGVFDE